MFSFLKYSKINYAVYSANFTPPTSAGTIGAGPINIGTNPQAQIAISRDGGQTFGQKWPAPIGQVGNTRNRTMWRRLGFARDSVVDLQVIDPVRRDIVGATLKAYSS